MKKIGIIIFIAAMIIGVTVANLFSFGRTSAKLFNVSFDHGVVGSGNVVSQKRDVSDFRAIEVGGVFEVEVVAQKEFSVEVEADDNLLQFIKTEVKGGTLEISSERKFSNKNSIRIRISAPDIENVDVSGVSKMYLKNLKNESLHLESSGASKIRVDGETVDLVAELSGASQLEAEGLMSTNVNVDSSGASSANVSVTGDLRADLSGASSLTYTGNPKNMEKKTSGASSIRGK